MFAKSITAFVLALTSLLAEYALGDVINSIHISSDGNNKNEAMIRAHKAGMRQTMKLISDKMGINNLDAVYTYQDLKKIFRIQSVRNEVRKDTFYEADVDYEYCQCDVNRIMLLRGEKKADEAFYKYLIIPVVKRGSRYILWQPGDPILDVFERTRKDLMKFGMYFPKNLDKFLDLVNHVDRNDMKYCEIVDISDVKSIRSVLVVVMEEFVESKFSSEHLLNVEYTSIENRGTDTVNSRTYENFKIINQNDGYSKSMQQCASDIISSIKKKYGRVSRPNLRGEDQFSQNENIDVQEASIVFPKNVIYINTDIYSNRDLERLKEALNGISQEISFEKSSSNENSYVIAFHGYISEYDFVERLYDKGFGYVVRSDGSYFLVHLKSGV